MDTQPIDPTLPPTNDSSSPVEKEIVFDEIKKEEPIDPSSFLLPQKPAQPPRQSEISTSIPIEEPASAPVPAPPPPPEKKGLAPLRTFRADIEKTIGETNASLTSIAAAESTRRASVPIAVAGPAETPGTARILILAASALFILGGGAALSFLFFFTNEPQGITEIVAPVSFIAVDEVLELDMTDIARPKLMDKLVFLRDDTRLSIGLIRAVYPTVRTGTTTRELVSAENFLTLLSPEIPSVLKRTLRPEFMLGIHSFEGNQPFLIFKLSSYEQAFAGALEWERTMRRDLSPFFAREPRPRTQTEAPLATSTAFLTSGFADRLIQNRDTRALRNEAGDILLLYTFLDRTTLLITTNENTLAEVVTRLKDAPRL